VHALIEGMHKRHRRSIATCRELARSE
jgi:hypothetical protein